MQSSALSWPHLLLAVAVMAVWGTNFVVIKIALQHLPPLLLATLRFAFVFFPLALFLKRPAAPWSNLAAYGILIGAGQFGLLFLAMKSDITPGLASLIVQTQIFFTIAFSMRLSGERVRAYQLYALAIATAGLAIIFLRTDGSSTPLGIGLVLMAALSWAGGNLVARAGQPTNMLSYVVWAGLFSVPPLLLLSIIFEGWPAMVHGVSDADATTWAAVLWQSAGNTMFGYTAWGWLLARYPASIVTPMALLVPVFGMGASALVLGEQMPAWKIVATGLVMTGLALNLLWPIISKRTPRRRIQ
ncbi:MAG: EamA family transporter [Hyphomonadaceae bacterium]|nr:EamA family transporter [Hyphomonadaceae bacterium]